VSGQLFNDPPATYPDSVLLSIYNAYPRKCNRKEALKRISEALDRICAGEIDGQPRSQPEAIAFLREKTDAARREMFGREEKWIPHATTFYHGSRYLRSAPKLELPPRLDACVGILSLYPKSSPANTIWDNIEAYLPALAAIDKALERMERTAHPLNCERSLKSRTEIYAMAVKQWPVADLQFVPAAKRWFDEERFNHNEQSWQRQCNDGFQAERDQISRLVQ